MQQPEQLLLLAQTQKKEQSFKDLKKEKLQEMLDDFTKKFTELTEKLKNTDPSDFKEFLKISEQLLDTSYELTFFVARVFLETKYVVKGDYTEIKAEIKEPETEEEYQELLKKVIDAFKKSEEEAELIPPEVPIPDKLKKYLNKLKDYRIQLEEKLNSKK